MRTANAPRGVLFHLVGQRRRRRPGARQADLGELQRAGEQDGHELRHASTGCEVCVSSKGTQEIDELFDDTLSEDEDCHTVQADTGQHEFELKMELEACVLRVKFPMVVKPL